MTTPAGWYDDGSGRQRWWDGQQWTEHFAPEAAPAVDATPEVPTSAEIDAVIEAADESPDRAPHDGSSNDGSSTDGSWSEASSSLDDTVVRVDRSSEAAPVHAAEQPAQQSAPEVDWSAPAAEWSAPTTEQSPPAADEPARAGEQSAPPAAEESVVPRVEPEQAATPSDSPSFPSYTPPGAAETPTPGFAAPVAPQAQTGFTGADPSTAGYLGAAPAYGSAPAYGAVPAYGSAPDYGSAPGHGSTPAYGAAPAYGSTPAYGAAPGGYPGQPYPGATDEGPKPMSIIGLVGLGLAVLGTILVCIPVTTIVGWVLLFAGFVVSIVSLFLKGKKWPGFTGIGVSVLGAIVGVIMAFVFAAVFFAQQVSDFSPDPAPSASSPDDGTGSPDVEEGSLGSPVTVTQMSGTGEVTISSATWGTTNGSSFGEPENGGYLVLDLVWEGVDGTSHVNPLYFTVVDAAGTEGTYDIFGDATLLSGDVAAGESMEGTISFDIGQSDSYTVIITDELMQEVASITVEASAR